MGDRCIALKKKPKVVPSTTDAPTRKTISFGRDGLAAYTVEPASFPPTRVLYYNERFTVIRDLYPKASVHLLILPRDPQKNSMRPQDAFDDPEFLQECRVEEAGESGRRRTNEVLATEWTVLRC